MLTSVHGLKTTALVNSTVAHSISDGHDNVGIVTIQGQELMCKFIATIYSPGFSDIDRVSDFVIKARLLKEAVPDVVEILPHVVLNRDQRGDIQMGYLMKVEKGEQLRKIQQLSMQEKNDIQTQFNNVVDAMLLSGYALYDFSDDNVLWDGKTLTFIDLSPAGFKSEALHNADTFSVKWSMSKFLDSKKTI